MQSPQLYDVDGDSASENSSNEKPLDKSATQNSASLRVQGETKPIQESKSPLNSLE
jgi:hypothetical protein